MNHRGFSGAAVLGLNLGHDPSAAVLDGRGRILSAVHEARLTRVKRERRFPRAAIVAALRVAEMKPGEIRVVAYTNYDADSLSLVRDKYLSGRGPLGRGPTELMQAELQALGLRDFELSRQNHHHCHACAAYHVCEDADPLIITCDGYGDGVSMTLRHAIDGRVPAEPSWSVPVDASLGLIYQFITGALGFSMLSEEWKILGLEPNGTRGQAEALFEEMLENGSAPRRWNRSKLAKWLTLPARAASVGDWRNALRRYFELRSAHFAAADIAADVQALLETSMVGDLESIAPSHRRPSLACAGGVFLNVKLNYVLSGLPWVRRLSVFPAAGDGGNAVGAALAYLHTTGTPPAPGSLEHVLLGCPPGPAAFIAPLRPGKSLHGADLLAHLAERVSDARIVAIVRGRAEFGPRALLHRSLTCRPDVPALADQLNRHLNRDAFMPYGCSMLASEATHALVDWERLGPCLPYMIAASRVTDEFARRFRPVCHPIPAGGFSTRPHVIPDDASWEAELLRAVKARTGHGILLNTSFNLHGDPIVDSSRDAIRTFAAMEIPGSELLLEDCLLELDPSIRTASQRGSAAARRPRRRGEVCPCVFRGLAPSDRSAVMESLSALGLSTVTERAEGDEVFVLVRGTESTALMRAWHASRPAKLTNCVHVPGDDLSLSRMLSAKFADCLGRDAGLFADLLVRPGASPEEIAGAHAFALVGLLLSSGDVFETTTLELPTYGSERPAIVWGTSFEVAPIRARIYAYSPEGLDGLRATMRSVRQAVDAGDLRTCREAGLVLAIAFHHLERSTLERCIRECEPDALIGVHPHMTLEQAVQTREFCREYGLSLIGGSDTRPGAADFGLFGVQNADLGRFINRFPGLEI